MRVRVRTIEELCGQTVAEAFTAAGAAGLPSHGPSAGVIQGHTAEIEERLIATEAAYFDERTSSYFLRTDLEPGAIYEVLVIEDGWYRLLARGGQGRHEPVLFASARFVLVEGHQPLSWVRRSGPDGEVYEGPRAWLDQDFFFERFHDGEAAVVEQFWSDVRKLFPTEWERVWG